jgi:hypothetical protein
MEWVPPPHVHVQPMAVEDGCSLCCVMWAIGICLGFYGACYGQVTIVMVMFPALIWTGVLACCSSEWFPEAPFTGATMASAILFALGHWLLVSLSFVTVPLVFALVRALVLHGLGFAMVPDGMSLAMVPLAAGVVSTCMYRQWQSRTPCDLLLTHH